MIWCQNANSITQLEGKLVSINRKEKNMTFGDKSLNAYITREPFHLQDFYLRIKSTSLQRCST